MDEIKTLIFQEILTKEEQEIFLAEIKVIAREIYANKKVSQEFSPLIIKVSAIIEALKDKEAKGKFLSELEQEVMDLETLKITLAFEGNKIFVRKVKNFLESYLQTNLILDITVDESLIAGIRIERKGVYRDYSALSVLDELNKDKQSFKELIFKKATNEPRLQ